MTHALLRFKHVAPFLRCSLAGEAPLVLRSLGRACFRLKGLAGGRVQPSGRTATAATYPSGARWIVGRGAKGLRTPGGCPAMSFAPSPLKTFFRIIAPLKPHEPLYDPVVDKAAYVESLAYLTVPHRDPFCTLAGNGCRHL